ncbi:MULTISPECIES: ABC transporter permease [unclassified Microbacterium]|uniref:ABC transporter permease n=1 Tax=unclassified Microbacterium TaxID=2609290 RepID=UPI00214AE63F|nr:MULTISPECIES: ABC transporter permease [unclassified Microbacterium]MCR2785185.1 ABC transporter permease [Microbacterium sp. zg.B96]MDL5352547.1 ABC transporter permease [Microbacterium sp. zg-YB36]WIM16718.1 ABC transporter permease [Microbacterium sp. zg-B96]
MLAYVGRRLAQVVPMLLLLSFVVFALLHLAPYDVVDAVTTPQMSAETVALIRERYGLDQPFLVQYGLWLSNVLQGDLGYSLVSRHAIADDLAARIPATVLLVAPAYIAALLLAMVLGLVAAARRGTWTDRAIDALCGIGIATPSFWFALLVIYVFGYHLRWFPIIGMHSVGKQGDPVDFLLHFVMPFLVLTVAFFPDIARYVRSAAISQLDQDYVLVQRAFGATRGEVFARHVSRNVLLPIITQLGLALPLLVTGAIVTESIFGWPGVGPYFLTATRSLDYPVILAVLLLSATLVIIGNLIADILYVLADPRIRIGAAR